MTTRHRSRLLFPSLLLLAAAAPAACSSSNGAQDGGSDVVSGDTGGGNDGGADAAGDAGLDGSMDASSDASPDAGFDGGTDAGADAESDAAADVENDAGSDAEVDAGPVAWDQPKCTGAIDSQGSVTYTHDEGATLAPLASRPSGISYTYALAAADTPNNLYAEHAGKVIRSQDAGCTWHQIGTVPEFPTVMVAAPGGRVYAFKDNGAGFYRIEGDTITTLAVPAMYVVGLGADPTDGLHVRIGDTDGHLHESHDGGATWNRLGTPVPVINNPPMVYRYAFDPNDLDHIVVGLAVDGAFESDDGGATWTHVMGPWAHNANVFSVVISPADPNVVWMQGIDLDHSGDGVYDGRNVWRSDDRGLTLTSVVQQTADITIRNQELLAAHPTNPNVLYFVFGTYWGGYGTDIYRYDQTTGQVTKTHNSYNDVNAIAFSPYDPAWMYLGITWDAHL